jgi:ribonuclease HII
MTNNKAIIVGIDEVGRGPVAGPVVVCAFAALGHFDYAQLLGIRDSKKLSAKKREGWDIKLRALALDGSCAFSLAERSADWIDANGIAPAIRECVAETLLKLNLDPNSVYVELDGSLSAPKEYVHQKTTIKGDDLVPVISAASIIAKVYRDQRMDVYGGEFPGYGFETHKGYGTSAHMQAIADKGVVAIHRISFLKNALKKK